MNNKSIAGSIPLNSNPLDPLTRTAPPATAAQSHLSSQIPLPVKIAYTLFMAVLIPVYWANYGPTNFLYFCDVALLLTLAGVWTENKLLISLPAVGILIPQALWVADFAAQLAGVTLTGMTAYMFDAQRSLFLRGLSLFHGWLPFLLVYLVAKTGYDKRALPTWTALAWTLCLVCFFWMPPAGAQTGDPNLPININYVFGFNDAKPQSLLPAPLYLLAWMTLLLTVVFIPTHFVLKRYFSGSKARLTH